ncbi:MAG TPA: DUF488 domain-containing protein [Chitinophagaceae bacterium]|nr:DUF488 domain-containing protein [Chitinophagaceae bacterium]
MDKERQKTVWTIGHSTHPIDEFISLLKSFQISVVADIRNYPGSKRFPHFNKETLQISLREVNIKYIHFKELGGRRNPVPGSVNTRWRNFAFRGYADYMGTAAFKKAMIELEDIASKENTAFMCSEAVWWSCHRSLVSDYLKVRDWKVMHIMSNNKATEHPYTSAARIINGELRYDEPELF